MYLEVQKKPIILYAKNEINTAPLKKFNFKEIDLFFYFCFILNEKESEKIKLTFNIVKEILDFKPNDVERISKLFLRTHKKLLEINFTVWEKNKIILCPIFYEFEIDKENKELSIQIHPRFQHILNFFKNGNFTKINLLEIISLK
ncbi:replication initiation protein [Spiroplasma endosymbiont of Polydrusus pterygomalis]|uniref:replication initiation protein n=1 Tax=Spiroplasma endosymbiont of Polydrusus pterygomalis TaxID=3139327 RepID=UPI003CCB03A6